MIGYVYVIRSHQTDDVYYGSTTQMLCKRMAHHRACCKNWLNGTYHYVTSFELLKYEDAYIELVETVNFENKQQLYAVEGTYIRKNKCVNKVIPDRTRAEYVEANKERFAELGKQYREEHKEEILEYKNQYYEDNKEVISEYKSQWYIDNKESLLLKAKQYREANKEQIAEKQRKYRESKKNTLAK